MNMKDSKQEIILKWNSWWSKKGISRKPDPNDMSNFYLYLESDYPELLKFRTGSGDRWQDVRAWLNVHTNY